MATIAVYSSKGGVGKTSLSVNLAWASATLSSRRTLLWDLDAQAAASFILAPDRKPREDAADVIGRDTAPEKLIVPTAIPRLDLLPADASLRTLDVLFAEIGAKKRVQKIGEVLARDYDRIVIDCPPGLGVTAEQVIRGASLILLPMIPSALATRAADELVAHLDARRKATPPVMPVFSMVDRRRLAHRDALVAHPERPAIPMASAVEQMADRHAPLGAYAPRSPATQAVAALWQDVERRLAG
ncbi:ParA family protein [Sphingomonas naphthae]|uniref:ParA family protein n=1 Tax=Sphingomonas naphthae TaxID=1813468 RepID=A0ABY7TGK5_9SPHN|nr:ParA family protein [Sphingomonas naphthae]WCT71847.1 ParA family protein [Sphingomonas naphthae]